MSLFNLTPTRIRETNNQSFIDWLSNPSSVKSWLNEPSNIRFAIRLLFVDLQGWKKRIKDTSHEGRYYQGYIDSILGCLNNIRMGYLHDSYYKELHLSVEQIYEGTINHLITQGFIEEIKNGRI